MRARVDRSMMPTFKFKMGNIEEIITKGKTPITCDNENCKYKGVIYFCYNGNERDCGIYQQWERNMMMKKYSDKSRNTSQSAEKKSIKADYNKEESN